MKETFGLLWENEGKIGYDSQVLLNLFEERGAAIVFRSSAKNNADMTEVQDDEDVFRLTQKYPCGQISWLVVLVQKVSMGSTPVFAVIRFIIRYLQLTNIGVLRQILFRQKNKFKCLLCSGNA
jgi:hypothetical protein